MLQVFMPLIYFMGAGILVLVGVLLGAYMVFKTKREPHEPFIAMRQPVGDAFNIDQFAKEGEAENVVDLQTKIQDKETNNFLKNYQETGRKLRGE